MRAAVRCPTKQPDNRAGGTFKTRQQKYPMCPPPQKKKDNQECRAQPATTATTRTQLQKGTRHAQRGGFEGTESP